MILNLDTTKIMTLKTDNLEFHWTLFFTQVNAWMRISIDF